MTQILLSLRCYRMPPGGANALGVWRGDPPPARPLRGRRWGISFVPRITLLVDHYPINFLPNVSKSLKILAKSAINNPLKRQCTNYQYPLSTRRIRSQSGQLPGAGRPYLHVLPYFGACTFQTKKTPMPCHKPLLAWRSNSHNVYSDKIPMVFSLEKGIPGTEIELPCGQCAGCRLDYARQWAIRCCNEAQMHDKNCFLTLTYREMPENDSLQPKDMQNFLKRLRKHLEPQKVRFFQAGEYGDDNARPHHHCLLFGHDFDDKLLIRRGEYPLYQSETLDRLWGHGFASIGEVTFDSACYVARYILKKITGPPAEDHYQGRKPEYTTMSRRPGIGRSFYDAYTSDIYNHDRIVVTDGFLSKPPRFYDKLYEADNPTHFNLLKEERRKKAQDNPENTPERRKVKAELTSIRQNQISRSYENEESPLHHL